MQHQSKLLIGAEVNFLLVEQNSFYYCISIPFFCESIFLQFRKCCLITPKAAMFTLTSLLWSNEKHLGFLNVGLVSMYINPSLVEVGIDVNPGTVGYHCPCSKVDGWLREWVMEWEDYYSQCRGVAATGEN